jgi:hypothetical protein
MTSMFSLGIFSSASGPKRKASSITEEPAKGAKDNVLLKRLQEIESELAPLLELLPAEVARKISLERIFEGKAGRKWWLSKDEDEKSRKYLRARWITCLNSRGSATKEAS